MIHEDAASLIGRTPLVELRRLSAGRRGSLFAKVESLNPGFSKKDRIAKRIIDDALREGRLKRGDTVVELTSGNTGTGLAILCAVRELTFVAVMSSGNSPERRRMMEALGARVEIVPQAPGSPPGQVSGRDLERVEARTQELVRRLGAFRADQFHNPSNVRAHEEGTAEEIWGELGDRVTHFCDFVGSGGTFVGVARGLKRHNPAIRCHAIEPAGAALLGTGKVTHSSHRIQGGGYSLRPPLWEETLVDGYLTVTDEEAIQGARDLARREGLFAGFSSGANVAGALALLERAPRDGRPPAVVITLNDAGLKYLSTDLWP